MIRPTLTTPRVYRASKRTMVYVERNLTLIQGLNPWYDGPGGGVPDNDGNEQFVWQVDHHDYCAAIGYRPMTVAYEGTFHRALTWYNDNGTFRDEVDWNREQDNLDPSVNALAVEAIAKLVRDNPYAHGGGDNQGYIPLMIDIETVSHLIDGANPGDMLDLLRAFRNRAELGFNGELLWFSPSILSNETSMATHGDELTRICPKASFDFYSWDATWASSGRGWFADVAKREGLIDRHFPAWSANKVAVITPRWTNNYSTPGYASGDVVPLAMWQDQVGFLVDHGWELFLWGSGKYTEVKPHLDYLAKFAR